jgi:hypothetical protein
MDNLLENILKSNGNNNNINIKSVLADGCFYDNNKNFKYLYEKKILPGIKIRKNSITSTKDGSSTIIKPNSWPRRNLTLTGLYYHFSTYGESIKRPTTIGAIIVGLSTAFWIIQNNPTAEPYLPLITSYQLHDHKTVSNFITVTQFLNNTHWLKAFERSFSDLIPSILCYLSYLI